MRALTIRQPWIAAIVQADKRIENRVWPTRYRGPILLHAARSVDRTALRHPPLAAVLGTLTLHRGAVVGIARIADCHPNTCGDCTPWSAAGQYHLALDDVRALPRPVPWRGALGLWVPPPALLDRVRQQLGDLGDEEQGVIA